MAVDTGSQARAVAIIGTRGYPSFYGGFETAVRRIAPALADMGWDVRVYSRRRARSHTTSDPRIKSVYTPGIRSKALGTLSFGLTSTLHSIVRKPDVALVMNVANGFWLPLLKLRGIPSVVNVDGIEWHRDKWSPLGKAVFRWGARFTARFADELIFDAEAIGDYWLAEFGRTGVFIPYGGDPVNDAPLHEGLVARRYVLLVARFVPENSVREFLEAAPLIVEQCDVDVVLVGAAPPDDHIQMTASELAARNPRVHVLGHVSDDQRLFGLWRHAGAYFHGHTVGGTNPALVQAMALGARVVARDTVFNREVLAEAGIFCGSSVQSIVEGVATMLSDNRPFGTMAAERAKSHYSWGLVIDGYAAALKKQLGGREVDARDRSDNGLPRISS